MNSTVKTVGAYILGVVTGLGIAYVISGKRQAECTCDCNKAEFNETATSDDNSETERGFHVDTEAVMDAIEDDTLKRELEALTAKYREKPSFEDIPSFAKNDDDEVEKPVRKSGRFPWGTSEKPYVISNDAWNELPDYEQIALTYYADGKLADSADDLVENAEFIVGTEWRDQFEKFDEDLVLVRNDALKCDYEIARDVRRYKDILEDKPYLTHNIFNAEQMAFVDGDDEE